MYYATPLLCLVTSSAVNGRLGENHNCPENDEGFYDIEEGSALLCKG